MNKLINIILLRLKLIFRNPSIKVLMIAILAIFVALIGSLYANVENSINLKIAYVNEGDSNFSYEIIQNIYKNEFLEPVETTLEKGIQKIKKGEVEALFVIKADIEDKILDGKFDELIDFYYLLDNRLSPMIGDVFVGEMLQEISILTAINYLEDAVDEGYDKEEVLKKAYDYGKELAKHKKENYYVNIEFITRSENITENIKNIDNKIIYKQMILGIILTFLSFFILFTSINIVKDKENKIINKVIISKTSIISIILGEYFSIFISSSFIALIFAIISAYYSRNFVNTFLSNYIVLLLFIASFSALIIALTKFFKKVSSFIVVGSALILILGIISGCFFNIDLTLPIIKKIAYITPSYQALRLLIDFIIFDELKNFNGYVIYTCFVIVFLLILSIGLLKNKSYESKNT